LSVDETLMQLPDGTRCPNRRQLFRTEKIVTFFKRPVKISGANPEKRRYPPRSGDGELFEYGRLRARP
jgi:hypothetical protein